MVVWPDGHFQIEQAFLMQGLDKFHVSISQLQSGWHGRFCAERQFPL